MCYEPTAEVAASHRCFAERAGRSALPIALSSPTRKEGADQLAQGVDFGSAGADGGAARGLRRTVISVVVFDIREAAKMRDGAHHVVRTRGSSLSAKSS